MKKKITATVLSQKEIAPRIFDMWIATDLAEQAKAGQFIGVYPKDRSTLLPRPISICQVSDKRMPCALCTGLPDRAPRNFLLIQKETVWRFWEL